MICPYDFLVSLKTNDSLKLIRFSWLQNLKGCSPERFKQQEQVRIDDFSTQEKYFSNDRVPPFKNHTGCMPVICIRFIMCQMSILFMPNEKTNNDATTYYQKYVCPSVFKILSQSRLQAHAHSSNTLTYRPNRSLIGPAKRPPKTPPSATTEIAVEYRIS